MYRRGEEHGASVAGARVLVDCPPMRVVCLMVQVEAGRGGGACVDGVCILFSLAFFILAARIILTLLSAWEGHAAKHTWGGACCIDGGCRCCLVWYS